MAVILILGILAAVAYPSYTRYRLRSHRDAGTACLLETQRRIAEVFARTGQQPTAGQDLSSFGFGIASLSCGDQAEYQTTLDVASAGCTPSAHLYCLVATPQGAQAADGTLRLVVNTVAANPNQQLERQHQPPGGASWIDTDGWNFTPGR
ncbi:MAG: hypothetical protein KGJ55_12105 [Gammaproteobacteria bacterium]|nr:hypothetical protein [Gammaproteobacteria bacterium]